MPKRKVECLVAGCTARAYASGCCKPHYLARNMAACIVENCYKAVFANARCQMHYRRRARRLAGEAAPPDETPPLNQEAQDWVQVNTRVPPEVKALIESDGETTYSKAQSLLMGWYKRKQRDLAAAHG